MELPLLFELPTREQFARMTNGARADLLDAMAASLECTVSRAVQMGRAGDPLVDALAHKAILCREKALVLRVSEEG